MPVAALAAGPIDAELALAAAGLDDARRLYAWHREAMRPSVAALDGWDDAVRAADFIRLCARVPGFFIRVRDRDCGYLQVLPRARVLHVVNVAFGPDHRGRGYGSRLFAALRAAAVQRGCGLHLKAYRSNPRALAFYQREGFVVERLDDRHWWLDWQPGSGALAGPGAPGPQGSSQPAASGP